MPILNYTTSITVERTAAEISKALAQAKAQAVLSEYDPDGILTSISFRIMSVHGVLSFRLPANIDNIFVTISQDKRIPLDYGREHKQAA